MNTIRTLNLGAFPKKVLDFQESTVYLEQLTFIDYQLSLLLQNEFNGKTFIQAGHFEAQGNSQPREKLDQLLGYVISVNANYNDEFKTVVELLYFNIIMAHLHYLGSNFEEMNRHLGSVSLSTLKPTNSVLDNEFIEYLICRYHVVSDYYPTNVSPLIEYLSNYKRPFKKSQVNANYWLDLLYSKLTSNLTNEGQTKLDFGDLKHLKFWNNPIALIGYSGYLLRTSSVSETAVSATFKADFSLHLANVLNSKIAHKIDFPNSEDTAKDESGLNGLKSGGSTGDDVYVSGALLNAFIYNLYETIHQIPFNYTVLKPALSKKFLINCTLKTYQSQTVLVNLIKALIELGKLDEAIAAFRTYKEYVIKDLEQNNGVFEDILTVVDIYAICLVNFNPLKAPSAFQTTSTDKVLVSLKTFSQELLGYLDTLKNLLELTYDEDEPENTTVSCLSFLYKKYNVNVLLSDHSQCIELLSQAWFSLGYFHYFLAVHGSPTTSLLESNKKKVLKYYKNGLIVNSTGNLVYLFNYAMALSYEGHLKDALKLCKFILKKYPESFKTWNLMVLLTTSFETSEKGDKNDKGESEKFINNALNIAGLFIAKHHQKDVKLTTEAKYEILQLKLTQMAVWESIHGVKYILEYLPEVFMLYHELFAIELQRPKDPVEPKSLIPMAHDSRWSHRPSVIDPRGGAGGELLPQRNGKSKETKRLSMRIKDKNHNHTLNNLKHLSLQGTASNNHKGSLDGAEGSGGNIVERKILQDIWLWTAKIYLRIGMLEESEQCIVEAETILEPNHKTFTMLGYLTSKTRKFLSLQEFERSLEALSNEPYNKVDYGNTLLGLCKLFLVDDELESSLFISEKDRESGLIRLKNMLERFALSWPHGSNSVEVWYYLSKIYESVDDKTSETTALWRCVELEDYRPVRGFDSSDNYSY